MVEWFGCGLLPATSHLIGFLHEPDRWMPSCPYSSISRFFGEALLTELASTVWKERLAAMEVAQTKIRAADPSLSCQLVSRLMMRKPGLKDNNFQVISFIQLLATFSSRTFMKGIKYSWYLIYFWVFGSESNGFCNGNLFLQNVYTLV